MRRVLLIYGVAASMLLVLLGILFTPEFGHGEELPSSDMSRKYEKEFQDWVLFDPQTHWLIHDHQLTSPDGTRETESEEHGAIIPMFGEDTCFTLYLRDRGTPRRQLLTLRRGDSCSAGCIWTKWTTDSKAIMLKGWYEGTGCYWVTKSARPELSAVYLIDEAVLLGMPLSGQLQ